MVGYEGNMNLNAPSEKADLPQGGCDNLYSAMSDRASYHFQAYRDIKVQIMSAFIEYHHDRDNNRPCLPAYTLNWQYEYLSMEYIVTPLEVHDRLPSRGI